MKYHRRRYIPWGAEEWILFVIIVLIIAFFAPFLVAAWIEYVKYLGLL